MANQKSTELTGVALDWAVAYSIHLLGCKLPYNKAAHENARAIMAAPGNDFPRLSSSWELGSKFNAEQRISTFELDGAWYAVHHADLCSYMRDISGEITQVMVHEDSSVKGDNPLEAGLRCFVLKTVGESIDIPDLVIETALA